MLIVFLHANGSYQDWFGKPAFAVESGGAINFLSKFITQFVQNFGIGVDIFFLLSGFLITYILLEEKKKQWDHKYLIFHD
jgi:peptidoglycan/LPS O-acetylase OafA/YrhL